jgi:hypothetical protein
MAYEYRNRCGDVYRLQAGKTRTGRPSYYLGRKLTGEPVADVPAGYEVHESPERGQVYLRKARPTRITASEREVVAEGIRQRSNVAHFIVEVEGRLPGGLSADKEARRGERTGANAGGSRRATGASLPTSAGPIHPRVAARKGDAVCLDRRRASSIPC